MLSLFVLGLLSSCAGSFYQGNQMYIPDQDSAKVKISGVIGYSGYQVLAAIPIYKGINAYGNFLNYNTEIDPSAQNADAYRNRQNYHEEYNLGFGYNPKSNLQREKFVRFSFVLGYGNGFGSTKKGVSTGPGSSLHYMFIVEKASYHKFSLQPNIGFKRKYSKYNHVIAIRASYIHLNKYYHEKYFDTYYSQYNDYLEFTNFTTRNKNSFLIEPSCIFERQSGKYITLFIQATLRYFTNSTLNYQRRDQAWEAPAEFFVGFKFNPAFFRSVLNKKEQCLLPTICSEHVACFPAIQLI